MPKQDVVRPTKEQVREAIFSSIGGSCEGLTVLDLFAGAGSLGLEAWSRGADEVVFVEQHPAVWRALQNNVENLQCEELGPTRCIKGDALRFLERAHDSFDLILADPPYDLPDAMNATLNGIAAHSVLTPDGMLVYELRASDAFEVPSGWEVIREKKYGYTRVLMMKQSREDAP